MVRERIRFQKPVLPSGEAIERYLARSREERWFSNFGPCAELHRARLTDAVGRPCVVVSNATLGLMVAIAALRSRAPQGAAEVLVPGGVLALIGMLGDLADPDLFAAVDEIENQSFQPSGGVPQAGPAL